MAYLSIREVAERLHYSYSRIWQMCRCGHIPAYRIGRLWRIEEEDMEEIEKKLKAEKGEKGRVI